MKARKVGEQYQAILHPKLRSIDEATRTIEFVSSTQSADRYGDRIMCAGWDLSAYRKNPVVLWSHDTKIPPVGKTVAIGVEMTPAPALIQKIQFADAAASPLADQLFRLYQGGFLSAVSVGFLPTAQPTPIVDEESGRMTGYQFDSQELLECSLVAVPANSEALARAFEIVGRQADPNMPNDPNADEPGEPAEDEPAGSLEDLCEEVQEAIAAASDSVAVLLKRIQGDTGNQPPPAAGNAAAVVPIAKSPLDALLAQLAVRS